MGAIIISNDAMAGGFSPDAFQDPEAPWYFQQTMLWDEPALTYEIATIDVHTSRNLPQDYTLGLSIENSGSSVGVLEWQAGFTMFIEKA